MPVVNGPGAKYATAQDVYFRMIKAGTVDFAVTGDWTPATGDVKISIDGAAQANAVNLPVAVTGAFWRLSLTVGETTGGAILINIVDTAPKAVEDQALDLYTYGNASAAIPRDVSTVNQAADVAAWKGTTVATPTVAGIPTVTLANPAGIQKNAALSNFTFLMIDSVDHITPKAGLGTGVTAQRSLDGNAFAACANTVSEVGSGVYRINLAASDLNADVVVLKFTATGADQRTITILTEPI